MSPASSTMVLEQFTQSPQRCAKQCTHETGISRSIVQCVLKCAKWKIYIPELLNPMNEDDPNQRVQFCERFQHMVHEVEKFESNIVWFDEATFKLNGTGNRHNCAYWASEDPHIYMGKAINLPGLTV